MISICYNQLVKLDLADSAKVKGDLAESWTISEDVLTHTFKLKPGITFASGPAGLPDLNQAAAAPCRRVFAPASH